MSVLTDADVLERLRLKGLWRSAQLKEHDAIARAKRAEARVAELKSIEDDFQTMEQRADAEIGEGLERERVLKARVEVLEARSDWCPVCNGGLPDQSGEGGSDA